MPLVTRRTSAAEVLPASSQPLTREELHHRAGPKLLEILQETCTWTDADAVGDSRFAVFSFDAGEGNQVCLQVWSQRHDVVVRVMGLIRSEQEKPEHYERRVFINHEGDSTELGRELIDVLYQTYAYRGLVPLQASLAWVGLV